MVSDCERFRKVKISIMLFAALAVGLVSIALPRSAQEGTANDLDVSMTNVGIDRLKSEIKARLIFA